MLHGTLKLNAVYMMYSNKYKNMYFIKQRKCKVIQGKYYNLVYNINIDGTIIV